MMNPFTDVQWNPNLAERRKFGRSLVIGFPIVAALMILFSWLKTHVWHLHGPLWIGGVGVAAGLLFWAVPQMAKPFYIVWYGLACCIGLVVGNILIGLIFYVFISGIGCVMRLVGRHAIQRKFDRSAPTYWQEAEQPKDPSQYYRQY